jgi:hypothetical protein
MYVKFFETGFPGRPASAQKNRLPDQQAGRL